MKHCVLEACPLLACGCVLHSLCPSSCLDLDPFCALGETPLDQLYFKDNHNIPLSIDFSFMVSWEWGELHNLGGYFCYPPLRWLTCKLPPFQGEVGPHLHLTYTMHNCLGCTDILHPCAIPVLSWKKLYANNRLERHSSLKDHTDYTQFLFPKNGIIPKK